jgi:hypothetical protein
MAVRMPAVFKIPVRVVVRDPLAMDVVMFVLRIRHHVARLAVRF